VIGPGAIPGLTVLGAALPAGLLAVLGASAMLGRRLSERAIDRLTSLSAAASAAAFAWALLIMLRDPHAISIVVLDDWFSAGDVRFSIKLLADPMSLAFALMVAVIGGMVAAFSHRYLHREPGYRRYFILFATFLTGMLLVVLAGGVEVLFTGWELIGVSSALLVGFFHERPAPVRNALRVFSVYRLSDAAMLSAAILIHHVQGRADFDILFGGGVGASAISAGEATLISLLLAAAAAGKCAQLPFSDWLPRAMEGPTPSSAVYYGALSVHAGAFLLLRAAPLLDRSAAASALVVLMGACTAVYAVFVRRVQTDVKSSLAFASLAHVSLILVEIGAGLRVLAFLHIVGNAFLRLLQFLRAPSVLHDLHEARKAVGAPPRRASARNAGSAKRLHAWTYRFALERGYVEGILGRLVVDPLAIAARRIDAAERWIADRIAGVPRAARRGAPP